MPQAEPLARLEFDLLAAGADQAALGARLRARCAEALARRLRVLILAADGDQAAHLDQLLWEGEGEAFLPHAVAEDSPAPILICLPEHTPAARPVVINRSPNRVTRAALTIIELVDDARREQARQLWTEYRNQGLKPLKNDC